MTGDDVLVALRIFDSAGIEVWIGGGWGVDALVGRQTRAHQDLDLVFDRESESRLIEVLVGRGFEETLDWRPGRFVMSDGAIELDLHPIEMRPDGSAIQRTHDNRTFDYPPGSFTTGTIGGETVPCITASLQREFHQGYEPVDKDRHDLALLESLLGAQDPAD